MKIDGKIKGEFAQCRLKFYKKDKSIVAKTSIVYSCDREQTERYFGDRFARLSFGAMVAMDVDAETETDFGFKSLTPAMTCGDHVVTLLGRAMTIEPVIKKVEPTKGLDVIRITVEYPIKLTNDDKFTATLIGLLGELVEIELKPKTNPQGEMEFEKGSVTIIPGKGRKGSTKRAALSATA